MTNKQIKDLSNKAEGIFHYVGNNNVLFRIISTGNRLTSDVNESVALFNRFIQRGHIGDWETENIFRKIYHHMGALICLLDIVRAASGQEIDPEISKSIDISYKIEYQTMLHEAIIKGLKDDYKGFMQNPHYIPLVKPAIAFGGEFDSHEFDDGTYASFIGEEEPRDRRLTVRCTSDEWKLIWSYCKHLQLNAKEEETKND